MVLVNGGFLHCTDVNSSLKATKKKIGKSNLKKSGERSRAILALFFLDTKCYRSKLIPNPRSVGIYNSVDIYTMS